MPSWIQVESMGDEYYVYISIVAVIISDAFVIRVIKRKGVIVVPRYSTIEHPKSARFIQCLRRMVANRQKHIKIDFGKVETFNYESYLVIFAQVEKAWDVGKNVRFFSSGKIPHALSNILSRPNYEVKIYHQHVVGPASKFMQCSQITPELTRDIEKELKRIGIRNYFDLNTLVTEIIGNAVEHGIGHSNINWWMYHTIEKGTLKMVFVDMGKGIASSYRSAGIGCSLSDARLLKMALNGEVGSSTKEPNRGRGLPQMDFMVRNNFVSNFILITNNVTLRYNNGKYIAGKHPNFVGTYYSWTVNKENFTKWQKYSMSQKTTTKY